MCGTRSGEHEIPLTAFLPLLSLFVTIDQETIPTERPRNAGCARSSWII